MTQDEMQKLWEALSLIYGRSLQAATVTVLIEDGDSAVRFVTSTFPQKESKQDGDCKKCKDGCAACDARRQSNVLP